MIVAESLFFLAGWKTEGEECSEELTLVGRGLGNNRAVRLQNRYVHREQLGYAVAILRSLFFNQEGHIQLRN